MERWREFLLVFLLVTAGLLSCEGGIGPGSASLTSETTLGDGGGTTIVPAAPQLVAIQTADSALILSFDVSSDATSYNAYWSTSQGVTNTNGTRVDRITTSPYTLSGLSNGTLYYVRLSAQNGSSESGLSDEKSMRPTINPVGNPETSFGKANGLSVIDYSFGSILFYAITVDASGRFLLAGAAVGATGNGDLIVTRLTSSGALDTSFATNGAFTFKGVGGDGDGDDAGKAIVVDSSGSIYVAGYSANSGGKAKMISPHDMTVWKLTDKGALDTSFNSKGYFNHDAASGCSGSGDDVGNAMIIDSSGRLVIAGKSECSSIYEMAIWRLNASSGSLDTSFATGGVLIHAPENKVKNGDEAIALVEDSNKCLVATGTSADAKNYKDMAIWKICNGSADTSFGTNGMVTYAGSAGENDQGFGIALDSSGRIVVAGSVTVASGKVTHLIDMAVWRYTSSGSLDSTCGSGGIFTHDGAAGGSNADDGASSVAIDSRGRIVVAGYSTPVNGYPDAAFWRLTDSCALDTSFGGVGYVTRNADGGATAVKSADVVYALAIDASGRYVFAGSSTNDTANLNAVVWLYK